MLEHHTIALTNNLVGLLPRSSPITFHRGEILQKAHSSITHVHFVHAGLVSLIITAANGKTAETGYVRAGGWVGNTAVIGATQSEVTAIVRIPGHGVKVAMQYFLDIYEKDPALRKAVDDDVNFAICVSQQIAACTSIHSVEQRFARWLLLAAEASRDLIELRQDEIAEILSVQRTTVSMTSSRMEKSGLIQCRRGRIKVLNRSALEQIACQCGRATN